MVGIEEEEHIFDIRMEYVAGSPNPKISSFIRINNNKMYVLLGRIKYRLFYMENDSGVECVEFRARKHK